MPLGDFSFNSNQTKTSNLNLTNEKKNEKKNTKNEKNDSYEIDYGNSSQTNSGETTYVLPGGAGSSNGAYQTSSGIGGQSVVSGQSHSSAYSALSASLASLKNRLSARGVTLAEPSGGYSSGGSASGGIASGYGDSQQHQQGHSGSAGQSQATYLSVTSAQHEQPSVVSAYSGSHSNQGNNDNKTIVLAIPAKINFLTDAGRSSSPSSSSSSSSSSGGQKQLQHQTGQQQPLTLIQQSVGGVEQQARGAEYSTKQLSLVQEASLVDPSAGNVASQQDPQDHQQQQHQQYVIVNQAPSSYGAEPATQYVTANLGSSVIPQAPSQTIYHPNIYTTISGLKYIPTYQQQAAVPLAAVQPAAIQKLYTGGPAAAAAIEQSAQEGAQVLPSSGGSGAADQMPPVRYCLDTCNPGDARWRKYSYTRYKACCSRSSQQDPSSQYDFPSVDKVSETSAKFADDAYYNYLYRRSRARRSRRNRNGGRHGTRYGSSPAPAPALAAGSEDDAPSGDSDSGRVSSASRSHAYDGGSYSSSSSSNKYYRGQRPHSAAALDGQEELGKYSSAKAERGSYRRGRARDLDAVEPMGAGAHESSGPVDDDQPSVYSEQAGKSASGGYGSGEYSVADSGRYQGTGGAAGASGEEEDAGRSVGAADELVEPESARGMEGSDYTAEPAAEGSYDEADQPETTTHKYSSGGRRRKSGTPKVIRFRKPWASKEGGKQKKSHRKNKYQPNKESHSSSQQINGTDYDSAQPGVEHQQQYHQSADHPSNSNDSNDEQSSYSLKDSSSSSSSSAGGEQGDSDKETSSYNSKKYKASLNDSTVANLSKTTMHLKEILSILEKKAHLKLNETSIGQQQQQQQQQPATSTPAPTTTTFGSLYPSSLFGSQYSSPLQSALSSEYLTSELSMKSPYRLETPSLASSLSSSPSLSLSPSAYSSLSSTDHYSPLSSYPGTHYSLSSTKHIPLPSNHHPRKRRPSKNVRPYNNFMLPKPYGLGASSAALLQAAAAASKSPLSLSSAYYPAFQYNPHWYPRLSSAVTNPYPYRNMGTKNPYSLLNGPLSSKLAAAAASGQLYSDDTRLHGLSNYDPIANVASSLRPSTAMRLKSKPFVFQPQVLPIYTRHTILTPSDVKKR